MTLDPSPVLRIAQITDSHICPLPGLLLREADPDIGLTAVIDSLKSLNPPVDLIVHTGDLIQDEIKPSPSAINSFEVESVEITPTKTTEDEIDLSYDMSYARARQMLSRLNLPIYCIPGNHDPKDAFRRALDGHVLVEKRHLFCKSWQLIMLDSNIPNSPKGHLATVELEFLADTLFTNLQPAIILMHHAPVSVRSRWLDTMTVDNAPEFFSILNDAPHTHAVIFGHIHASFECTRKGLTILGAPSTAFQFKPKVPVPMVDPIDPGYRLIELDSEGRISTTVIRTSVKNVAGTQKSADLLA